MDYRITLTDDNEIIAVAIQCVHSNQYGYTFFRGGIALVFVPHDHMKLYEVIEDDSGSPDTERK